MRKLTIAFISIFCAICFMPSFAFSTTLMDSPPDFPPPTTPSPTDITIASYSMASTPTNYCVVEIYNEQGILMYKGTVAISTNPSTLLQPQWDKGTYFVVYTQNGKSQTFMLQHS